MLSQKILLSSIRLGHAVGQRPTGHFDHDANNAEGPGMIDSKIPVGPSAGEDLFASSKTAEEFQAAEFESFQDPSTGEQLFKKK